MTPRDRERLKGVHPYVVASLEKIFAAMAALGFPMFVVFGVRTQAEQVALYALGRTKPGAIVTNRDGIVHPSEHQAKSNGYGYAVDCAFVDDPTTAKIETWADSQPWLVYGTMGEALGLKWGGRWTQPHDLPHLELPVESPHARVL